MSDKTFIPNSFQTPNILIDELMPLLSDTEWRVLCYMTRHILGWQDKIANRQRHMSLNMFVKGFGEFKGCGLGKVSIGNALESLAEYKVIKRIGKADAKGQLWELAFDNPEIEWEKLRQRQADKELSSKQRTVKATEHQPRNVTSDVPSRGTLQQRHMGRDGTVTSDVNNQTQVSNPSIKPTKGPSAFNEMKDAIRIAHDWAKPTDNEWGQIQKAAKQLLKADVTPADIPSLYKYCVAEMKGKTFTPLLLTTKVSEWRKANKPAPAHPSHIPFPAEEPEPDASPMPDEMRDAFAQIKQNMYVHDEVIYGKRSA